MNHAEQDLHRAVAEYLDAVLLPPAWWTTIPAGGGGKVRGAILKGMGYKAGTPDLMIVQNGKVFFVELKIGINKPSLAQREVAKLIEAAGAVVGICYSLNHVRYALERWGVRTRENFQTRIGRAVVS